MPPLKIDDLVKSLKRPLSVIPAHAGIQYCHVVRIPWIPVFTGMTTFYNSIKIDCFCVSIGHIHD
jgi:hypothetical protein